MKHATKRLMALLLAAVMLFGLLPATALAAPGNSTRAGTEIDVTDYGADPTGAKESSTAVIKALAAAKDLEGQAVTISFPKGEYHFYADKSEVRELYVSNTVGTNQSYKDKRLGILVEDMDNVTIEGNGSQFIYHGDMTAFATIRSNNVTFQNFSVDYASPSVIDVTVESLDTENKTAILYIPACYTWEINGSNIRWTVEGNSAHSGNNSLGYSQAFDTVDGTTARGRGNPFSGVTAMEKVDGTHIEVTYSGALPVLNRCYQMRNTTRTTPGTFFWESDGVTLNNINIQFLHGFGMVGQLSKNITLDTVKFETRPGTGRTSAGFADFIQMSSIGGKVTIRNCDFSNPHDDPINIHGTFLKVTEVSNENKTFKLRYQHDETGGFPQYYVGDEVEFATKGSMAYVADSLRTVESVVNPGEGGNDLNTITITLNKAVSGITADNYVVENVTYTPEVLIENCRFVETPTRGVLVTTRKPVVIRNNYFDRMGMAAIFISCDAQGWYESGRTQDVTIENNVFHINSSNAILVEPTGTGAAGNRVHNNMTIKNNTIYMWSNVQPFNILSVDGLTIEGNTILRYTPNASLTLPASENLTVGESKSLSPTTQGDSFSTQLYNLRACENVTIRNNLYDDGLNLGVNLENTAASDVTVTGDALTVGGNNQLPAVGTVTYYSDDPAVATVSESGVVTGMSAGTAHITAFRTVAGRTFASDALEVTVTGEAVTRPDKIEIDGANAVEVNAPSTFTATATTSGMASTDGIAWAVKPFSDGAVATIDQTGALTATAPGVVEITASKGGVTVSKLVTVKKPKGLDDSKWEIKYPSDTKGWNLNTDTGVITLDPSKGGGDYNDGTGARNLFVTDAPDGDFSITMKLNTAACGNSACYDEAGLIVSVDHNNYVSVVRKNQGNGYWLSIIKNSGGTANEKNITEAQANRGNPVYLRLSKSGNTYTGEYSYDNTTWNTINTQENTLSGFKVGFFATNCKTSRDVTMEDFKINNTAVPLVSANTAPSVDSVALNAQENDHTVMLAYDYSDDDGDNENGTLRAWYAADTRDGHYTRIGGAVDSDILHVTAATSEKWVKAVVIPRDATGRYGAPVTSNPVQAPKAAVVDNDATLSSLSVTGLTLSPAFDPNVTQYTVNVPATVASVTVNATATQASANVAGTGEATLTGATAIVNVYVFAPNNTTNKTYTITIHRARSSDVTLKAFTASDNTAVSSITYDPAVRFYGLVAPSDATHLSWSLTAPAGATVTGRYNGEEREIGGNGFWPMKPGLNHLELRVTAEDGLSTALYRVRVLKPTASSDATLQGLMVEGTNVLPNMTDNETMVRLDEGDNVTIHATPASEKSTVHISVNGKPVENNTEVNLTDTVSTAIVRVVAEDGVHESVYTVTLIKNDPSSAELYKLDLGKVALDTVFDANTENYTAVNYGNLSTTLNAMAAQEEAKITYETVDDYAVTQDAEINKTLNFYKGDGLVDETDGKTYNTVIVTVTSPDGNHTKTYTVKVEMVEEVYLSDLNWMSGSFTGWGSIQKDLEVSGGTQKMQLMGPDNTAVTFDKGLGTHANSEIYYDLSGMGFTTFTAKVGMDYSQNNNTQRLRFDVLTDDANQYTQTDMGRNTAYATASVTIPANTDQLTLKATYTTANDSNAHADWAEAKLSTALPDIANQTDILIKHLELEDGYTVYANEGQNTLAVHPVVKPVGAALSGRQRVLEWSSENIDIATAGQGDLHEGIITGRSVGETTVTVTNPAKTLTATCNVTVKWKLAGKVSVTGGPRIGSTLTGALNQLDQGAKGNVDIQWWRKGANDEDFAEVDGATEKDYTVDAVAANVGAQYKVIVTAKEGTYYDGTSESDPVTMTKLEGQPMKAAPTATNASAADATNGAINGLFKGRVYQYQKVGELNETAGEPVESAWETFHDETGDETGLEGNYGTAVISGLATGHYVVRRAADDLHEAGAHRTVTIDVVGSQKFHVTNPNNFDGNIVQVGRTEIAEGDTMTLTVTPKEGYELVPGSLKAIEDDTRIEHVATLKAGTTNQYTITMPNAAVTISAEFRVKTYSITHDLTNITCSLGDEESHTATHGERFTITLTPDEGYEMKPTTITVTNADKNEPFNDYTYLSDETDPAKRVLTFEHGVTCNITISGKPDRKTYPVDYSGVTGGLRAPNAPQTATHGQEFTVTLEAARGYALPETVTVTVGGAEVEAVYDKASGKVTVSGEKVTGNIAIEAEGVAQDLPLQTVTMVGPARVGRVLTVNTVPVNARVTYQWYYVEGGVETPIENATGDRYVIPAGDKGKSICVKVKAVEGSGYNGELTSEPTAAILGEAEPFVFVESVTLDETASVAAGKSLRLTVAVTPDDPTSGVLFWSSDNEAVATVDQNGVVTGVAEGVVTITAAATDRLDAAYDICTVTVTAPEKPVSPSRPSGNNSGSTTTKTETREDGAKVTTVTKPDGTVTETVAQPDGTKSETITTKDGDVTITVTDENGEELVKAEIPATIPEPETKFEDVTEAAPWAEEAIHKMAGLELVNGTGDNKYSPVAPMTRGSLATVLHRLSQGKTDYEVTFKDVAQGKYYTEGVAWAAKANVVKGISEDVFAPDQTITREQLAVMLCRYAKLVGLNTKADAKALEAFTDGDTTGAWAVDGVAWCVQSGILKGKGQNNLDPTADVTRAEVAVMLDRFIALLK